MYDRLAAVHALQPSVPVAGISTSGGVRPSSNGGGKRAGGRYVLGDLLGRGGMAEVFSGNSLGDHGFQKPVAIKRLLPELANDEVFVERLIGEAKLLVGMQHGNVVSVLDLARDGDDVFLVMEFVDGPSLRQLLKSRGQRGLPLGVATYVVQGAAAGLEFAHNRPGGAIIHADISPSNILLTTSGEVRVADFGIARREGGGHGIVEGKWAYMAPEQARGEPLTPRSDVFALGVVLYELICGAHPFGRQVTHEERDSEPMRVIPPRVVKPTIPHGIDAICMRALAHDPRDRYRSMQQLIDAIVEERFANQWREGASDLAAAIRECNPLAVPANLQPRTMVTDRPLTIATRSLLRELTPVRASAARQPSINPRGSRAQISQSMSSSFATGSVEQSYSESYASESYVSARGTPLPPNLQTADSGARTNALIADDVIRAAGAMMLELPPLLRADGTPLPPFRLAQQIAPGQDLASVIGGHTHSKHVADVAIDTRGGGRWVIGVLLVAAIIGAIAAWAIARRGSTEDSLDVFPPPTKQSVIPEVKEPVKAPVIKTEETKPAPITTEEIKPEVAPVKTEDPPAGEPVKAEPAPETPVVKPPVRQVRQLPKREPGWLRVNSDPYSTVTILGQSQPTIGKFTLPPGKYKVRFERKDLGLQINKVCVVESGKMKLCSANLYEDN